MWGKNAYLNNLRAFSLVLLSPTCKRYCNCHIPFCGNLNKFEFYQFWVDKASIKENTMSKLVRRIIGQICQKYYNRYFPILAMIPSASKIGFTVALVIASLSPFSLFVESIVSMNSAFGDGLTQEELTGSLGNRKADLLIKMIPAVVTTETLGNGQKPIIEFRLFDSNTNQSFSHVTYYIILEKDGKKLFYDMFHDHDGDLKIQMNPNSSGNISITGDKTPILDLWIGTSTKPVAISGPIFLSGGLYHFIVRIETVDSDTAILPDNQAPIYDSWLSIGNTENQQIDVDGKEVPIKIISYYDKLKDFGFDTKNMQLKFDMPFNWNLSRLENANIFVHEEINVPKPNACTAKGGYTGTVNGVNSSKNVMLDNSNSKADVIHVMLPKNDLLTLADRIIKDGQALSGIMSFTVKPQEGSSMGSMPSSNSSMSMGPMS